MAKIKDCVLENVLRFVVSIAPDGQTATINFDGLRVSVGGKNSPSVATQVASFTLPIIENATDFHVKLFISGYVFTQPGTRAIVVAHLGDTTASSSPPSDQAYLLELEATFPAGVAVQPTLFLLAERNSVDENLVASLEVEALDFNLG